MIIKWEFIKNIFKKKIDSVNEIRINKKVFLDNYKILTQITPNIIPVLKSNWYGFGIKNISKIIQKLDIKIIAVDSLVEYFKVIKYLKSDILIMWETLKNNYKLFDFKKTHFCVYNKETILYLKSLNKNIKIHLFLNSWMNREWIKSNKIEEILDIIKNSKLNLIWICTHFSSFDDIDNHQNNLELSTFLENIEKIKKTFKNIEYIHSWWGNSIVKINNPLINFYRVWLLFYWYNWLDKNDELYNKLSDLKNTLWVYSKITSIQEIIPWEWVSYNLTYKTNKKTKIATIPFWYYEWLNRFLSNNFEVKINWKYYQIAWRICMNYISVDIWNDDIKLFDEVEIISHNKDDKNSIWNIAKLSKTINYEILVKLNNEIKRVVI